MHPSRIAFIAFGLSVSAWALHCPETDGEWLQKRDQIVEDVTGPTDPKMKAKEWKKCLEASPHFASDEGLKRCFVNHKRLVEQVAAGPIRNTQVKDFQQYVKDSKPFVALPDYLRNEEFEGFLQRGEIEKAEARIGEINGERLKQKKAPLLFVKFDATAPDVLQTEGEARFLIYNPGDSNLPNTEQWINFSVPDGKLIGHRTQLSVLATHTNADGKATTYYADHQRVHGLKKTKIVQSFEDGYEPQGEFNCIKCHSSGGPIAIRPKVPIEKKYLANLQKINERIKEIPFSASEHFDPEAFNKGEIFDFQNVSNKSVRGCFSKKDSVTMASVSRVKRSLACINCHDGSNRGRVPHADQFASDWIKRGFMPADENLSKEEQEALAKCWDIRLALMKEHVKNSPCKREVGQIAAEPAPVHLETK